MKQHAVSEHLKGRLFNLADYVNSVRIKPSDCIVVNGFWRSGTTWLQESLGEALCAKLVFEPFDAANQGFRRCLVEIKPQREDVSFLNALMPYVPNRINEESLLYDHINRSLRGQRVGPLHRGIKRSRKFSTSFRSRVITKFTRGALCLSAIANTFQIPVVHIFRDTRAVVASITENKKPGWAKKAFVDFSLAGHLLDINDGRSEYFSRWRPEIVDIDKSSNLARLAAYHCLTERYVCDSATQTSGMILRVRYEDLIKRRDTTLGTLLQDFGLISQVEEHTLIDRPSFTSRISEYRSNNDRVCGWKQLLNTSNQNTINDVIDLFEMREKLCVEN